MTEERRRSRRLDLEVTLLLKRLNGEGKDSVMVEAADLSRSGIGFRSDEELQMGTIYEANLLIWTQEVIHAFIEIVRKERKDGLTVYGGVFVGMTENDLIRIEVYEKFNAKENEDH